MGFVLLWIGISASSLLLLARGVDAAWHLARRRFNARTAASLSAYVYAISSLDSVPAGGILEDLEPYCAQHRFAGARFMSYAPRERVQDVAAA